MIGVDPELVGEVEGPLDRLGPDGVRDEVARDDADLGAHEAEAEPMRERQVPLERLRALRGGHGPARVEPRVDPGPVVGGLERVLLEEAEPLVDPRRRGLGVAGHVALAEDLDAGRARVRDGRERRGQVQNRAVVAHEAVQRDAVAEDAVAALGPERDRTARPEHRGLVLEGDVGHAQPQLDRELVDALREAALKGDGDQGGLLERPPHAVALPQFGERVRPPAEGPQRDVRPDVDRAAHSHGDAVDEGGRHAPVRGHADAELEAGDAAALADVAEAD